MKKLVFILMSALISGCAYNAPVSIAPNLNVYSSYGEKIPGSYLLFVDSESFNTVVRPTGLACSAHNFPLDLRAAFKQSAIQTVEQLVESVEVVERPVATADLVRTGKQGMIVIRSDAMTPRLIFIEGLWSATADASVELSASMTVDGEGGRLLGTTASGTGSAQGSGGSACGGGALAVGQATEKAVRQLLGQLGERMSNSQRLRRSN